MFDLVERVGGGHARVNVGGQALHAAVDGPEEQLTLGWEVTIDRALADAELVRDDLNVGVPIAAGGEQTGSYIENLVGPPRDELLVLRAATVSGGGTHGVRVHLCDGLVRHHNQMYAATRSPSRASPSWNRGSVS